jgi:hypothetical protein
LVASSPAFTVTKALRSDRLILVYSLIAINGDLNRNPNSKTNWLNCFVKPYQKDQINIRINN